MTKKQAWECYDHARPSSRRWELQNPQSGLLLPVCGACGFSASRETYVGFWTDFTTLIQDNEITALGRCRKCGSWNQAC